MSTSHGNLLCLLADLQLSGWCAANLVMGGHASPLTRRSCSIGRPRCPWIGARHGGRGAGRSRLIPRRISTNKPSRDRDLGQLECDVAAMTDHLCSNLDQLLPQSGQGPVRSLLWAGTTFGKGHFLPSGASPRHVRSWSLTGRNQLKSGHRRRDVRV